MFKNLLIAIKRSELFNFPKPEPSIHKPCPECEGSGCDEIGRCSHCEGNKFVKKSFREIHNLPE